MAIATSSTTNWISRRENLDRFCACFTAHARSRAPTLARLRIGVLLRDHGTEQEQQEGVRAYLRPLVDEDHDWRAARASAEIALAYAHGRGARKNRFAAIEWAQHASRLQPDDEGIDEIQSQVLNSHSLVKTIGTVFGAYMGRGGISAEDLPPAGRAVGMARPGRSGWKLSSRLLLGDAALAGAGLALGTAPLWLYAALPGALGVAAGALALPLPVAGWAMLRLPFSSRPPGPEDGCSSRSRTRRRCSARSNGCAPRWARAALDAVYLNSECNASIRQHRRLWGGTRNVLWLGLPLLELLSADACRAILAHECAHIAGRHGRYASRVYFARLQWQEAATGASQGLGQRAAAALHELARATPWQPAWISRANASTRPTRNPRGSGVACASDALMATCLQGRALHEYASSLYADAAAKEPPWPLVRLAEDGLLASPRDQAEAQIWLHQALCRPTSHDDTHPSLADRLAALKVPRALDERTTPAPGMPGAQGMASTHSLPATSRPRPGVAPSPARRRNGCRTGACRWHARSMIRGARPPRRRCAAAQDERREAVAAHHDPAQAALRALSADERARMAWHAAMLADDVDGAMKLLQENLRDHPGHVPSLCELATLLQRQNARPDAAPDANTTRGPDDARREPAQDAAEARGREAAAQPGPHRLACLRQLTAIALRRGDAGQAWPGARKRTTGTPDPG